MMRMAVCTDAIRWLGSWPWSWLGSLRVCEGYCTAMFTILRVKTSAHKGGPISRPATPNPSRHLMGTSAFLMVPPRPQRPLMAGMEGPRQSSVCRSDFNRYRATTVMMALGEPRSPRSPSSPRSRTRSCRRTGRGRTGLASRRRSHGRSLHSRRRPGASCKLLWALRVKSSAARA